MKHISFRSGSWIATFILCIGMTIHANAQTFTERVQQKAEGKGTVTLHQSSEIEQLLNDPTATDVQQQPTQPSQNSQKSQSTQQPQRTSQLPQKPQQSQPATPTNAESDGSQPKPTGNRKVVIGYRVQAFAGGNSRKDRQAAEQARNDIKALVPGVPVDVHFYSPRWICRVGNYRTYEEAHQMMVKLQNLGYKQATIVKGKITVTY